MTERSGTSKLRPRAQLIGLIDEDLFSVEPVAVVELVKNSYDAGAAHVTVRFDPEGTELVIEDDDHGITLRSQAIMTCAVMGQAAGSAVSAGSSIRRGNHCVLSPTWRVPHPRP